MKEPILIIYHSKTGFTRRYAVWLSEALGCQAIPASKAKKTDLSPYAAIVYGGGFYAGKINGIGWFKKQLPFLKEKAAVVFATGAMPSSAPEAAAALRQNFTDDEWQRLHVFYMQGGLCYEKMNIFDKGMMRLFRWMLSKKAENQEMLQAVSSSYDNSSEDQLAPLLSFLKQANGIPQQTSP